MRPITLLLVFLLVASNLAWWLPSLLRVEPPPTSPPPTAAPAAAGAGEREAALTAELQRAQSRIAELETKAERTPVPAESPRRADREARAEAQRAVAERRSAVYARSQEWVEAALQTTDPARRARALDELRQALSGNEPAAMQAALGALAQLRELDYDKASFRPLVLPCLQSADGDVRAAALYALWNTAPDPGDLPGLLAMVDDPAAAVRQRLTHVVGMYSKGKLEGEAADVALKLLNDKDASVRSSTMAGIGARVDQRIEQHFVDMLADREQRREAVHFALSRFDPKSTRVVAALVGLIDDPNFEVASSARRGLTRGVAPADRAAVADAFLRRLETKSGPGVTEECLEALRRHGSAQHVPALEVYAARPGLSAATKQSVEALVAQLRTR